MNIMLNWLFPRQGEACHPVAGMACQRRNPATSWLATMNAGEIPVKIREGATSLYIFFGNMLNPSTFHGFAGFALGFAGFFIGFTGIGG